MAMHGVRAAPLGYDAAAIEKLGRQASDSLDAEKKRLRKATREFESFFMYQLLKTMRKTVPKSPFNKDGVLSGESGKEIFTELFDMQLARKMVTGGEKSISETLYGSLLKILEAQYAESEPDVRMKPLRPAADPAIELERERFEPVLKEEEQIKMEPRPAEFAPLQPRPKPVRNDEILSRFGRHIQRAAADTALDPALIISVIKAESNGDPTAVSRAGAKGLMQLADSTAADYGVEEVFDPEQNIQGGSRFLKDLIERFGSLRVALAAYNAGPGNVMRYGGVPPFAETERYVEKVLDTLNSLGRTGPDATAKVSP
ncbi:MAG: transglycosylase SLT domain-containing protein [Candidatus Zixiibacteriota bacterium]|nr:MAG: transglycosylase SLT domain-containing protein [candidate division Zixibacteria bacterium]